MRNICLSLLMLAAVPLKAAELITFHHENVLGTRMELRVECGSTIGSTQAAEQAESVALHEIDRLARIFSTYDPNSELNRWIALGAETSVSVELRQVLESSERWHQLSKGAFQPSVELLSLIWRESEQKQQLPSTERLRDVVQRLTRIGWDWSDDRTKARPLAGTKLSFDAIAKGYIIDAVCAKISLIPEIHGGMLSIGGDMRAIGEYRPSVQLQRPVDDLAAKPFAAVKLSNCSIATSNAAFRGVSIGGVKYSHILDPRTGYPAIGVQSVTVIAPCAMDADALATACNVLLPSDSVALVDSLPGFACMILDHDGVLHRSANWHSYESLGLKLASFQEPEQIWNGGMEMKIDFSIRQPERAGRYRRPYVAVWIEDKDGNPLKTLVLWIHNTGHGQRWLPDLKRWYRSDNRRQQVDKVDLVTAVSEATRRPGAYSITWNGQDDHKKLVPAGEYVLCIEAAREHGTYQLIRKKISIDRSSFKEKLDDNVEIHAASIDYRAKPSK
ncbi:MAG: DUF2271 domain-containing protein [Pirellula sp.]